MEADDKLVKWLRGRATALKTDYDKASNLDVKKNLGAKLKQVKDILHYINVHKTVTI